MTGAATISGSKNTIDSSNDGPKVDEGGKRQKLEEHTDEQQGKAGVIPVAPQVAIVRHPPPQRNNSKSEDGARSQFGSVCVVTGPSGVGKSTLIKKLLAEFPGRFGLAVSHTTRDPRPGEENGVAYHFITQEKMKEDIAAGAFIEHAQVHGKFYGTSIASVEAVMATGAVCLLDIDVQGAASVRSSRLCEDTSFIFFAPPSDEILEQRLRGRGTETEEKISIRLQGAKHEMHVYNSNPDVWNMTLSWINEQCEDAYSAFRAFLRQQVPDLS